LYLGINAASQGTYVPFDARECMGGWVTQIALEKADGLVSPRRAALGTALGRRLTPWYGWHDGPTGPSSVCHSVPLIRSA
jgi:hypothetical protein